MKAVDEYVLSLLLEGEAMSDQRCDKCGAVIDGTVRSVCTDGESVADLCEDCYQAWMKEPTL